MTTVKAPPSRLPSPLTTTRSAAQPNQLKRTPTQPPASPTAPSSPASSANPVVLSSVSREKPVDPKAQARLNEINTINQPMMTSTVQVPEGATSKTLYQRVGPHTTFAKQLGEAHTGSVDVTHTSKRDKVFHEGISVDVQGPGASLDVQKSHEGRLGKTTAYANGEVKTAAHAHAAVTADHSSLKTASLNADLDARAIAQAQVHAGVRHDFNDSVSIQADGEAQARAYAGAEAKVVADPANKNFGVHLEAGAGADASAGGTVEVRFGPLTDRFSAHAVTGVGSRVALDAQLRDGKASLSTNVRGAVLGGAAFSNQLTYDTNYDKSEHIKGFLNRHGWGGHHISDGLKPAEQLATALAMPSTEPAASSRV